MQLSRKRTCKNCMLTGGRKCGIGLNTEIRDMLVIPLEDCYKPVTSRQESDYTINHMNFHMEMRKLKRAECNTVRK